MALARLAAGLAMLVAGSGAGAVTLAIAPASGAGPVKLYDASSLAPAGTVDPYPGFTGGVRVAMGDVTGDGVADLVTGAGPGGGPHVRVFDGTSNAPVYSFFAYDAAFKGGVSVAAGDLDGDGRADIITGAGTGGGPHVKVFSGADATPQASLFAFDAGFFGGISVAAGDAGADGLQDLIVGTASGDARVRVLDGRTFDPIADFLPFGSVATGVSLATGRFGGQDALFVGAASGGDGRVNAYRLSDLGLIGSFLAFGSGYSGGLSLAAGGFGGGDALFVGQASGGELAVFDMAGRTARQAARLQPFGPGFGGGLSVTVAPLAAAVPEPATWAMMVLGFGLVGGTLRRAERRPARA